MNLFSLSVLKTTASCSCIIPILIVTEKPLKNSVGYCKSDFVCSPYAVLLLMESCLLLLFLITKELSLRNCMCDGENPIKMERGLVRCSRYTPHLITRVQLA